MKKIILPQIIFLLLLGLVFWGVLEKKAIDFVVSTEETSLTSLGLATEFMIESKALESTKVPLLSGSFGGISEVFSKGIKWISHTSLILAIQILVLTITKTLVVKIIAAVLWVGVFIPKIRSICFKLLVIFILLNPGLPLFAVITESFAKEASINLGDDLKTELQDNYAAYQKEATKRQNKLDSLEAKQAQAHGGQRNLFERLDDDVVKTVNKVENKTDLVYKDSVDILRDGSKKLMEYVINLFTNILVTFVILPFGFFYIFKTIAQHIINEKLDLDPPTKPNN